MKEEIALKIMQYWGYPSLEFDAKNPHYAYITDKYELNKKESKFNHAKWHALDLADLAMEVFKKEL